MLRRRVARDRRLMGSGQTGFTPLAIPGCVLWLRADMGITLATGVSSWADQSGNGNTASQATGAAQPTYVASDATYNGHPSLSFPNTNAQRMTLTFGVATSQPLTCFAVGHIVAGFGSAALQYFFDSTTTPEFTIYATGTTQDFSTYAGNVLATTMVASTPSAMGFVANGASSQALFNSSTPVASGNAGTAAPTGLTLGAAYTGASGYLNGKIAEILIYEAALSQVQIAQVLRYFGARYGQAWS